jgi:hypothetical protein
MRSPILRRFFLSDELPSTGRGVYLFFEFIALGFALEAVAAFVRRESWFIWAGSLLLAALFLFVGIKGPWLWSLFLNVRFARMAMAAIAAIAISSVLIYQVLSPQKGLHLRIGGMVIMGINGGSSRLQLTVEAVNYGSPTTAHGWNLTVKTAKRELRGHYMVGEQPAKNSLNLVQLDERLRSVLGTNDEVAGMLNFLFPAVQQSQLEELRSDATAKLILVVFDSANHQWSAERSISEIASERFEHVPSK